MQVTRDGVPVLWHDDDVIYGDVADPKTCLVKDLTLAQFQELCATSSSSSASSSPPSSPLSSSMQAPGSPRRSKLLRKFRDKTTHQWNDGLRPWDCTMDDGLPTLEAVFNSVPESVGFDIEVKMTTPDDLVHTPQEEIDRMLSAILRVVNDCSSRSEASRKRKIFFSSFDPDICTDLKRRKAPYPIYYLSGCGLYQHADARRTSIPAALDFATSNELGGVVLPASILIANKGMVQDARARELALMTYGLENNDLSAVEEQGRLGVHAAIIDDVEAALAHPGTPRVHVTADGTPADAGAKI